MYDMFWMLTLDMGQGDKGHGTWDIVKHRYDTIPPKYDVFIKKVALCKLKKKKKSKRCRLLMLRKSKTNSKPPQSLQLQHRYVCIY